MGVDNREGVAEVVWQPVRGGERVLVGPKPRRLGWAYAARPPAVGTPGAKGTP
jgi:hypothetical protein